MDRHPKQQNNGHQRVAGDEPGEGRHNGKTDQGDANSIEWAEHAAEPTGWTGSEV
jgi:hypothetical protein